MHFPICFPKGKADLILLVSVPDEEKKLNEVFLFTLPCVFPKGFGKTVIKSFGTPQRSVKIKI